MFMDQYPNQFKIFTMIIIIIIIIIIKPSYINFNQRNHKQLDLLEYLQNKFAQFPFLNFLLELFILVYTLAQKVLND